MIEVRFHGRGGQGVKKSAQILGRAAYLEGFYTQDFAIYGAERTGAPLTSFVRINKERINTRGYIFEPDFIVVLDDSLELDKCVKGMKGSTHVIVNTGKEIRRKNFHTIDATSIVLKHLKRPITNIAMLGALAKVSGAVSMKNLEKAVRTEMAKHMEIVENNVKAAEEIYRMIK